ncbi:alkaline phosphatase-like [Macrobrachium nipponense]|uniref:alkaline phosphatase-like n=1 Tax=Macrobrachium nipponense TaxID=159736 RepID=UPI0030C86C6C
MCVCDSVCAYVRDCGTWRGWSYRVISAASICFQFFVLIPSAIRNTKRSQRTSLPMTPSRLTVLVSLFTHGWIQAEHVYPSSKENENDSEYWMKLGNDEINEALAQPRITSIAKNVILFLGDGMGVAAVTAGRILKGQKRGYAGEEGYLIWERFPNIGLLKTYNLDKQVPDSAATATAFLSGVKGNFKTLGVNGRVKLNDCKASLEEKNRVKTILEWAQEAGKETGVVTTTQVTHATPAALYAKTPSRKWQCDTRIKALGGDALSCKDIARQLVEDEPGRNIKVIMGGGRQEMGSPLTTGEEEECVRGDGRDLVSRWKSDREAEGKTYSYATSTAELRAVDAENTEFILGLFGDLHVPYEVDRDNSSQGTPHIKEMVEVAIRRLRRHDKGFFLLVEGGRIDHGFHYSKPKRALEELLAFEEALERTLELVDHEETLVVVTADHSHVMTMNGYPERGNNILGLIETSEDVSDGLPYTTLMFTNGPGYNFTWNDKVQRRNLTGVNTNDKDFVSPSGVPTHDGSETHGGEDVAVYASGPMAHLFHRVHEQTYVAHVMGYAACIGPYHGCVRSVRDPSNAYETLGEYAGRGAPATANAASWLFVYMVALLQLMNILNIIC